MIECWLCNSGHGTVWVRSAHASGVHRDAWWLHEHRVFVDWMIANSPGDEP